MDMDEKNLNDKLNIIFVNRRYKIERDQNVNHTDYDMLCSKDVVDTAKSFKDILYRRGH